MLTSRQYRAWLDDQLTQEETREHRAELRSLLTPNARAGHAFELAEAAAARKAVGQHITWSEFKSCMVKVYNAVEWRRGGLEVIP